MDYATIATSSRDIFERIITEYPGRIFERQISKRNFKGDIWYAVKGLEKDRIVKFMEREKGGYVIFYGLEFYIVEGQSGDARWLAC